MGDEAALGEPGDGGDAVALEGEHEQAVGARDRSLRVGEVAGERWLAVGANGHESEIRAAPGLAVLQESRDRPLPWYS